MDDHSDIRFDHGTYDFTSNLGLSYLICLAFWVHLQVGWLARRSGSPLSSKATQTHLSGSLSVSFSKIGRVQSPSSCAFLGSSSISIDFPFCEATPDFVTKSAVPSSVTEALADLHSAPTTVASPMTRQRTLPGNLQPERTGLASSKNSNSKG